jgi:hypothetical protein
VTKLRRSSVFPKMQTKAKHTAL